GAADGERLAPAAGKRPGLAAPQLGKPRKELVDALGEPAALGARAVRGFEVLGDGEVLEHFVALRHEHDSSRGDAMRRLAVDALALVMDRALRDFRIVQTDEA